MKIPVVLKPGREEPWTPWRIIQAFLEAGVPREAFSFYPTDHEGSSGDHPAQRPGDAVRRRRHGAAV